MFSLRKSTTSISKVSAECLRLRHHFTRLCVFPHTQIDYFIHISLESCLRTINEDLVSYIKINVCGDLSRALLLPYYFTVRPCQWRSWMARLSVRGSVLGGIRRRPYGVVDRTVLGKVAEIHCVALHHIATLTTSRSSSNLIEKGSDARTLCNASSTDPKAPLGMGRVKGWIGVGRRIWSQPLGPLVEWTSTEALFL